MKNEDIFIVEIKAKCGDPDRIRKLLLDHQADFKGLDHQVDTYFDVNKGRLKLREGLIENTLIYYNRIETKGLKESSVALLKLHKDQTESTKNLHQKLHSIKVIVDKKREIYFIDNVKFHIDEVKDLGNFIEIEAINSGGEEKDFLQKQCQHYCDLFQIKDEDYVGCSYSDLLL